MGLKQRILVSQVPCSKQCQDINHSLFVLPSEFDHRPYPPRFCLPPLPALYGHSLAHFSISFVPYCADVPASLSLSYNLPWSPTAVTSVAIGPQRCSEGMFYNP